MTRHVKAQIQTKSELVDQIPILGFGVWVMGFVVTCSVTMAAYDVSRYA